MPRLGSQDSESRLSWKGPGESAARSHGIRRRATDHPFDSPIQLILITPLRIACASLLLVSLVTGEDPVTKSAMRAEAGNPNLVEGSFRIDRGQDMGLWVPPGESLEFRVDVDLGVLGEASVGTVTMSSGVEPFVAGLPRPGDTLPEGGELVGWVRIAARGGHLGYELDHSITTRFLPQAWPSLINSEVQAGSENRKREIKVGLKDGEWASSYRANGHCRDCTRREHYVKASLPWNKDYHCKKCRRGEHRIWNSPRDREVPAQTTDILGAVYLARNLVSGQRDSLELSMVQKENLWKVKLKRGAVQIIEVPAGKFRCREVQLSVSQPAGEKEGSNKFSGLFGIKGALKIWLHEPTGVPVLIEGDVPVGDIVDLHARIRLSKSRGTPAAFKKLP